MNYRHIYHAGSFADVFKHLVIMIAAFALRKKDKGFCYVDTHAGIGLYDLTAEEARRSLEFEAGIARIIKRANTAPRIVQQYVEWIEAMNPKDLRYYPGSPLIMKHCLRTQDRSVLCELHPEDYETLRQVFFHDPQVSVHHQNGYLGLKAFLPPKEKRGLILIDPPYEKAHELEDVVDQLSIAIKRFETGVFLLWYPIKQTAKQERFYRDIVKKISRPMLKAELCIYAEDIEVNLNGSGMLIVNPPWQIDQEIQSLLPWLWKALSPDKKGRYTLERLNHDNR